MDWWGGDGFGDWVWNVAFDGIGSTVVATAIAVFLVLRQLKADREGAWEEAFANDLRSMITTTEELEEQLRRIIPGMAEQLGYNNGIRVDIFNAYRRWTGQYLSLAQRLQGRDDRLRDVLLASRDYAAQQVVFQGPIAKWDTQPLKDAVPLVSSLLHLAVRKPDGPKKMTPSEFDDLLAVVRSGVEVGW